MYLSIFLKIDDLNESMKYIFKNVLTLQFHNVSTKLNNLSAKERKVVKIYSVCSLIGILVSLYLFFCY